MFFHGLGGHVLLSPCLRFKALMTYNKTQVDLERYAFVVLPDMRIDRVNDVWGDADPWSQLVKHVKARL